MSDFLSRLAHRAVALGAPRAAPGLAPQTPLEVDAEQGDAIDGRVAEPPVTGRTTAGPVREAAPVDRATRGKAPDAPAISRARPEAMGRARAHEDGPDAPVVAPAPPEAVDRAGTHDDAFAAGRPRDPRPPRAAETGRDAGPEAGTTPRGAARVEAHAAPPPERASGPGEGSRELARAAAAIVTARPDVPLEPLLPRTSGPRVADSSSEVVPVRIHIGRLEVRAALPDQPETRSPRRVEGSDAPAILSLSEYLRGEGRRG